MGRQPLLGHLAANAALASQGERLCTLGLTHVLGDPDVAVAFARALATWSGMDVPDGLVWAAEVHHPCAGRVDLEATDGGDPVIIIEAKLDAPFGTGQLASYAQALRELQPERPRALVVLVDESRIARAVEELTDEIRPPRRHLHVVAIDWQAVFKVCEAADTTGDARQLRALYESLRSQHLQPLSADELAEWEPHRAAIESLADAVTRAVRPNQRPAPSQIDRDGFWRRYISRDTPVPGVSLAVVARPGIGPGAPKAALWVTYSAQTPTYRDIVANLTASPTWGLQVITRPDAIWLPLDVPAGASSSDAITAVAAQVTSIDSDAQGDAVPVAGVTPPR